MRVRLHSVQWGKFKVSMKHLSLIMNLVNIVGKQSDTSIYGFIVEIAGGNTNAAISRIIWAVG